MGGNSTRIEMGLSWTVRLLHCEDQLAEENRCYHLHRLVSNTHRRFKIGMADLLGTRALAKRTHRQHTSASKHGTHNTPPLF